MMVEMEMVVIRDCDRTMPEMLPGCARLANVSWTPNTASQLISLMHVSVQTLSSTRASERSINRSGGLGAGMPMQPSASLNEPSS